MIQQNMIIYQVFGLSFRALFPAQQQLVLLKLDCKASIVFSTTHSSSTYSTDHETG